MHTDLLKEIVKNPKMTHDALMKKALAMIKIELKNAVDGYLSYESIKAFCFNYPKAA